MTLHTGNIAATGPSEWDISETHHTVSAIRQKAATGQSMLFELLAVCMCV